MMKQLLYIATVAMVFCAVYGYDCYVCQYDSSFPDVFPGSSEKCIQEPFKAEGIKIETGFKECYKAIVKKNDAVISAHRGGGKASLAAFAEVVSRDEDEFEITYCKSDLCNGAPSIVTSLGLLTSLLTVLYSFKLI